MGGGRVEERQGEEEKGEGNEAGGRRWGEQGKGRPGKRKGGERQRDEEQGKGRQGKRKEERSDRRKVPVILHEGSPPLTKVIKNFHQKNYFPAEFPVEEKETYKRSSAFHSF